LPVDCHRPRFASRLSFPSFLPTVDLISGLPHLFLAVL
jgi:hypothetical protein